MSLSRSSNFPDYGATDSRSVRRVNPGQAKSGFDLNMYRQLCDQISCNIFAINNNVTSLEKASKEVGTHADSSLLRDKIQNTQESIKDLVSSTTKVLRELNAIVTRGAREHKLQSERVRNEFQATIQRYDILQKKLEPKLKQALLQAQSKQSKNIWEDDDEEQEKQTLMDVERMQQQQQLQEELTFEHGMLLEREERIKQIESSMLDVNEILKDLAAMVHEQGDTIGSIEDNISTAAANVEEGHIQLTKAANYQRAYRKKLCCLILVLVLVAIALTLIIYFSIHN